MDEITRTLIPENGFGGGNALSLGAGAIGGLVLGSLWGNDRRTDAEAAKSIGTHKK